jgi:hypothetical protein
MVVRERDLPRRGHAAHQHRMECQALGASRRSYAVESELWNLQRLGELGVTASFCNLAIVLAAVTGFFATVERAAGAPPRLSPRVFALAAYPLLVIKLAEGIVFVRNGNWDPVSLEAVVTGIARQPPAWIATVVLVLPFRTRSFTRARACPRFDRDGSRGGTESRARVHCDCVARIGVRLRVLQSPPDL